jgi:FMN reductase
MSVSVLANTDGVEMVAAVTAGDVVVTSPTDNGTYTVRAAPLMLGGHWSAAPVPEVFPTPMRSETGASTPTAGLFLLDSSCDTADALDGWVPVARRQFAGAVPR